ncbi:MAG TPA: acyl-CoA desaturase [Opitutae bacterium]|nr:acyl-CoA desaturase [Opitutae bacterium]
MFKNIPFNRVEWVTSGFLIITALLTVTAVPAYLWHYGWDWFLFGVFLFFYPATGISITMGYHRLFSHKAYRAKWPVKLFVLLFGAAAFENSALWWSSEHRKHHKHVDTDEDPYDITKGFFWAHMGWLMFKLKPVPPMDNVQDLKKDKLVMWQHNWVHPIAFFVSFIIPTLIGYGYARYTGNLTPLAGALGGFLIPGVARVVMVQHATFCINSLCHMVGSRPYSTSHTARDSWIAAIFTMGEGYHNYHHEFEWDYRNGVKAWQLDPSKWAIWTLSKIGLTSGLRRVPKERILLAEMTETKRQLTDRINHIQESEDTGEALWEQMLENLEAISERLTEMSNELQTATQAKIDLSKAKIRTFRAEVRTMLAEINAPTGLAVA